MAEDKDDGLIDPAPLRARIDIKVSELMDLNQRITTVLRQQAKDFETIGVTYQALANRAFDISGMIADLALIAASNTGDILIAEFGIADDEDDEEEEDEEDEPE